MKHHPLKINRPVLAPAWTEQDMKTATTRIHNRFQGLLISIIESARWGNFHETPHPLEAHHPQWPDPGKYCDLILAKRDAEVVAALEVKTRYIKLEDVSKPYDVMGQVLEGMGSRLLELQQAAQSADALWVVALGIYRAPPQSTTLHHAQPFSVFMVWGRNVGGMHTPLGRGFWSSLAELDRAMSGMVNPYDFFSVVSLPKKVSQPQPVTPPQPAPPPQVDMTSGQLIELIRTSGLTKAQKVVLNCVLEWPYEPTTFIGQIEPWLEDGVGKTTVRCALRELAELGVIRGYTKRAHKLKLRINQAELIKLIEKS